MRGGGDGVERRRLRHQGVDRLLRRLALEEVEDQGDGLARRFRRRVGGRGDARDQIFHFRLLVHCAAVVEAATRISTHGRPKSSVVASYVARGRMTKLDEGLKDG